METKSKVLTYFFLLILLVVIFVTGWLWAKLNPKFLLNLPFTGTDNTANFSNEDQKNLANSAQSQVKNLLQKAPASPASLLNCNKSDCSSSETQTAPFQWIQYATYYYNRYQDQGFNPVAILTDLNTFPAKDFDWRLYQYGDILLNHPGSFANFEKNYLQITDTIIPITATETASYKFYTAANPADPEFLVGSTLSNKTFLNMTVVDYGTKVNTLADAYLISKDTRYTNELSGLLNFLHAAVYFDDPISNNTSELKVSSCSALLADVYAFKATKNRTYLGYYDYLNNIGVFQKLADGQPAAQSAISRDPMRTLPCLDALQQLSQLDSGNSGSYDKNYDFVLSFLKKNDMIISDSSDPYYGFTKMPDGRYDVNSSAWLVKIMAAKLSNQK